MGTCARSIGPGRGRWSRIGGSMTALPRTPRQDYEKSIAPRSLLRTLVQKLLHQWARVCIPPGMRNALYRAMASHLASFSFDIEDWYHSQLIPGPQRATPGASVVRGGTELILELLRRFECRATFFVLGQVVREPPDLVRRMVAEGHELGCHGMDHEPLWNLDPGSFRRQLREFRAAVEQALGHFPVSGFRDPTFRLTGT